MMIDFTNARELPNKYGGSEAKTTVSLNGETYMIKYPDPVRQMKNMLRYMNNQFSEYIGCRIFDSCGIDVQETGLGLYRDINGKEKLVIGCKDFTTDGSTLIEASKIAKQILIEGEKELTIENVNTIIELSQYMDTDITKTRFWDMFVVDALIGNADRHLENWGIIEKGIDTRLAPVYDCGSALAALISDDKMKELLDDSTEFKNIEFNKFSCYYMNSKRIYYHEIFKSPPQELNEAVKRIVPRMDINKIFKIIDTTPQMSEIRKEYLKKAVGIRYVQILLPSMNRILSQELTTENKEQENRSDDEIEGDF